MRQFRRPRPWPGAMLHAPERRSIAAPPVAGHAWQATAAVSAAERPLSDLDLYARVVLFSFIFWGPIYWLPGVDVGLLRLAKLALFLALLGYAGWTVLVNRRVVVHDWWTAAAVLIPAVAGTILYVAVDPDQSAIIGITRVVQPLLLVAACMQLITLDPRLYRLLLIPGVGFAILACFPALAGVGLVPNIPPPPELYANVPWLDFQWQVLSMTGFGGGRTGWGMSLVMTLLSCIVIVQFARLSRTTTIMLTSFFVCVALFCIWQVEARGSLAAILAALVFLLAVGRLGGAALLFGTVGIGMILMAPPDFIKESRLWPEGGIHFDYAFFNSYLNDRLDTWVDGLRVFAAHPWFGAGGEGSTLIEGGTRIDIHNMWLCFLAEGGIAIMFAFLPQIALYGRLIMARFNGPTLRFRRLARAVGALVIGTLVLSNVEPSGMYSAFQQSASFWFCLVAMAALYSAHKTATSAPAQPATAGRFQRSRFVGAKGRDR